MAFVSNPDDYITAGLEILASGHKIVHGIMFDGAWDLLCGKELNHAVSFLAQGMKVHKTTGVITRGILSVVDPASYGISNMDVLIDGDPDYFYVISVWMRNRESSATAKFYLGLDQ